MDDELLSLPREERARLLLRLLESLDTTTGTGTDDRVRAQEADRRDQAYLAGDEPTESADAVFDRLRRGAS